MDLQVVKQCIAVGNLDAVESAWMKAVEAGAALSELRAVVEALVEADRADTGETLAWMYLSEAAEAMPPAQAVEAARTLVGLLPGGQDLRSVAVAIYRLACGGCEHFDSFLRASGLAGGQSTRRAIRTLDVCLAAGPGRYLANRFDQQVVRVEVYDPVLCDFDLAVAGGEARTLEAKLLADEFDVVDDSDFRVLRAFRGDQLRQILQDDPAAVLVGICLACGGQVDVPDLKAMLVGRFVEKDKWAGWWTRARSAAKRCPSLAIEGRRPAVIRHYPHGRSLEQELAGAAAAAHDPPELSAVLQRYAREARQRNVAVDAAFVAALLDKLAEQACRFRARRPIDALTASLAIEAAAAMGLPRPGRAFPSAAEILAEADRPAEAVASLPDPQLWPLAFEALAAVDGAADHFEELLRSMPAGQLDDLAARLRAAGRASAIGRAVAEALANPAAGLQVCLWLWQGPAQVVPEMPSALDLLSRLLTASRGLSRDWDLVGTSRREAFQQVRSALAAQGYRRFRQAVGEMNEAVAATIKRRIQRSPALSAVARDNLLGILREAFYSLFLREKVEPWLDESVIWTTARGLGQQEEKLRDILEARIPANSRAIGEAASFGDLSENSEWEAAIAEQRRLQERAHRIQDELLRARALTGEDVPVEAVGIGSRVLLRRQGDAHQVEVAFLGPWDTDVPNRIYSYKAPLAQALMGKAVGETVSLKMEGAEADYTIERLGSALGPA